MRLRHIEVFHAIYTTGSVTQAAQILHISQPAVSKSLAHAEQQLGFALFTRAKNKLIPTSEAQALFPEVEQLYRQLHSVKTLADNIQRHDEGLLDIAITPALGFDVIPQAIARFSQRYPKVAFRIQTIHNDEAMQALVERQCELALLFASPNFPGVASQDIADTAIVLVYPRQLLTASPQRIELTELADYPLIGIGDSGPVGQLIWQQLQGLGIQPQSQLQVDTYYVAARLVAKGLGVCPLDNLTALGNPDPALGVTQLQPELRVPIRALHLKSRPLSQLSQQFLQEVRTCIDNTTPNTLT
ncbi:MULTISPECIES: LysR family transcriptional regulator [Pseudidiomarina]|uniref:LysR family transcriptional regulator n=1 Tax=Pseudidiomarina TaxID=2800384 RepID=UPI00215AB270|nr:MULTISPECIES: LysR family transcriptional regulator [Pseudidiomarina]